MPLQRVEEEIARETDGFAFPMRIAGSLQIVQVFVSDDALVGLAPTPEDEGVRAQLVSLRLELEALANERYACGRVTANGVVIISPSDISGFFR